MNEKVEERINRQAREASSQLAESQVRMENNVREIERARQAERDEVSAQQRNDAAKKHAFWHGFRDENAEK